MSNPVAEIAVEYVARILPRATTVVMGGSASTGRRFPSSDIDLLVFAPADQFENGSSIARVVRDHRSRGRPP